MHRRLLHKNQEVAKQNPPGVPKTSTKEGPGMRKKVRIIHPFTKKKGSSLLKKKKTGDCLKRFGKLARIPGQMLPKLPGSSTDLQGTELSLGPGVRKDSQVNPCLFSCEVIERMCWPILSLWLSLKKIWYVWDDAFLQFYRSFYPRKKIPTISAHSLTEFGLFSICSALKMIWKSASGMWASAIAVHGCDTTAELVSLPKLTVMRKRSDAVAKKTPRLPAILSVSQHNQPMFSSLKY